MKNQNQSKPQKLNYDHRSSNSNKRKPNLNHNSPTHNQNPQDSQYNLRLLITTNPKNPNPQFNQRKQSIQLETRENSNQFKNISNGSRDKRYKSTALESTQIHHQRESKGVIQAKKIPNQSLQMQSPKFNFL